MREWEWDPFFGLGCSNGCEQSSHRALESDSTPTPNPASAPAHWAPQTWGKSPLWHARLLAVRWGRGRGSCPSPKHVSGSPRINETSPCSSAKTNSPFGPGETQASIHITQGLPLWSDSCCGHASSKSPHVTESSRLSNRMLKQTSIAKPDNISNYNLF